MSTALDANYANGTPASDRSLPSFTPIRDASRDSDKAESSTSGSWRKSRDSKGSGDREAPSGGEDDPVSGSSIANQEVDSQDASQNSSKHRLRHSGGFLLDSAIHASRLPKSILSRSHKTPKELKGKRKSKEADLVIPKRRLAGRQDQHRSSIGGSPLASEIKQDVAMEDGVQQSGGNASASSQRSGHLSSGHAKSTESKEPAKPSMPRPIPPSIGFDTDPRQIVNMALSLSEGRRRQVSGMRMVSGGTPDRRHVSTGQPLHLRPVGHGGGSGQYFNDQRRTSRNLAPRAISATSAAKQPVSSIDQTVFGSASAQESQRSEDEQNSAPRYVSPATFVRVEKAKAYFELLYNFRRLLSHLPPLRPPTGSHDKLVRESEGRAYNPLQYVRNRKLRFREKKPLESEDEGWHDITRVRSWVDAVIASRSGKHVDMDECIRLPEFSQRRLPDANEEEIDPLTAESPASSIRRTGTNPVAKHRRPRSDWVTYPGDLLADAFWLEQGLNKIKIEDREGNRIYPPDTQFKFSGWRNRIPVHMPLLQESTPRPEDGFDDMPVEPHSAVPELPTFTSAAHGRKRSGRGKIRDSIIHMPKSGSGSRDRRRRLQQELEMTSSSESSDDEASRRGRKRKLSRRKLQEKDTKNVETDGHMENMKHSDDRRLGSPNGGSSGTHSKRPSIVDGSRLSKFVSRTSSNLALVKQDSDRRSDSIRHSFEQNRKPQPSFDETSVRTSAEYDTTAPSSPTVVGFPSIAINLSPPTSRSPSPSKRPFQARINPFRGRSNSKKRNGIETNDFADNPLGKGSRNTSSDAEKVEVISEPASRGTSPMTREMSPITKRDSTVSNDSQHQHEPHRSGTISRISTKSSGSHTDHASKIRGIFKGGRIAEIVGNEVNRVGDFIWKRDAPGHVPQNSTSTASVNSGHVPDSDDDLARANGHAFTTSPKTHTAQFPSPTDNSPEDGGPSPSQSHASPSSGEKPQYYNSNLPSFTSPFKRDREQHEQHDKALLTPTSSPPQQEETDHISRQAVNHRSASRSPRMDRLAPPKLVTTTASTPGPDRRDSYGFGRALDLTRSTDASQAFNDAIKAKPKDIPVTGLTKEKASASGLNLAQDWNLSDRNLSRSDGESSVVTRRDIARTRALLLSSGVKAREINRRANAIHDHPRKFLLDTIRLSNTTLKDLAPPRVPRKEEHVVAARTVIDSLTSQSTSFKESLKTFGTKTTTALHRDLQTLDDLVDNQLTPRVRIAADQAGELSMKLATTSTLAVKGLNDIIDGALRRRRRGPIRYIRRVGYTLIEWTVVGLLWAIWLVVTVFRVCLGTVKGVFNAVRWLLFL
jgi:hypothetical protein